MIAEKRKVFLPVSLKALLKGTKLGSHLLPACGSHTCALLCIDQHMQGPGLALVDFSGGRNMLNSGCAADDKFQKVAQGLGMMLKCSRSTSAMSPKRNHTRQSCRMWRSPCLPHLREFSEADFERPYLGRPCVEMSKLGLVLFVLSSASQRA